jgi:hypothetical protein
MRKNIVALAVAAALLAAVLGGCGKNGGSSGMKDRERKIAFLHHSTGKVIWDGGVKKWFKDYNSVSGTKYEIKEITFPAEKPYGWHNYPYDYWNIWVRHAGGEKYMKEPTLEILTRKYGLIVFKHCFPVSGILPDGPEPDAASDVKTLANYKLQYEALRKKMLQFPDTRFLVWTGAALVKQATDPEKAERAREFFRWVVEDWDQPGDNIFVWDFYGLETGGGLYMKDEFARSPSNSHPNEEFARRVAPLFCKRVVDVIEGRGDGESAEPDSLTSTR